MEKLASSRRDIFVHLSSAGFFEPIIESESLAVIVTDMEGNIRTTNSLAKAVLPGYEKQAYGSVCIDKYLKDKNDLGNLLGDAIQSFPRTIDFKAARKRPNVTIKAIRAKNIKLINSLQHHVIVLENSLAAESENEASIAGKKPALPNYVGESELWKRVDVLVRSVAPYNASVMIMGDTGKEVVAQALHRLSGRTGEFVAVNCGGLPRELLSSELLDMKAVHLQEQEQVALWVSLSLQMAAPYFLTK